MAADLGFSQEYNHEFWRKFRRTVKEANPNAIILAEHYGDASSWLHGDQWDTVMNYDAFMEPLTWFFTGMEKHSDDYQPGMLGNARSFVDAMRYHMVSFLAPSLQVAMNELSNHDHSRFLTRTNHHVGRVNHLGSDAASRDIHPEVMREAVVMQMTWPVRRRCTTAMRRACADSRIRTTAGLIRGDGRISRCLRSTRAADRKCTKSIRY